LRCSQACKISETLLRCCANVLDRSSGDGLSIPPNRHIADSLAFTEDHAKRSVDHGVAHPHRKSCGKPPAAGLPTHKKNLWQTHASTVKDALRQDEEGRNSGYSPIGQAWMHTVKIVLGAQTGRPSALDTSFSPSICFTCVPSLSALGKRLLFCRISIVTRATLGLESLFCAAPHRPQLDRFTKLCWVFRRGVVARQREQGGLLASWGARLEGTQGRQGPGRRQPRDVAG
jgi:hypothetical protein